MPKLKNEPIRIETGNTNGWQVRFYYQKNGQTKYHSKLFSDGVFGGRDEAYDAAIDYRDEHYEEFANEYRNREIEPYRKRDDRNNSGVPGIMFYEYEGAGGELVHVRAHVPNDEGRLKTRTLSLNKHGAEKAVQEVCRFRFEGLQELHGEANPYTSWQRLYNQIVDTVGEKYGLSRIEDPSDEQQPIAA